MAEKTVKTETFWTRNVRIIAFTITVSVFLMGVLIFYFVHNYEPKDTRPEMTYEQLYDIAMKPDAVTGEVLARYRGQNDVRRATDGNPVENYYYIMIEDRYQLVGTESVSEGEIKFLQVTDLVTKKTVDLLGKQSAIREFFD